jgi:hypothetical protein
MVSYDQPLSNKLGSKVRGSEIGMVFSSLLQEANSKTKKVRNVIFFIDNWF